MSVSTLVCSYQRKFSIFLSGESLVTTTVILLVFIKAWIKKTRNFHKMLTSALQCWKYIPFLNWILITYRKTFRLKRPSWREHRCREGMVPRLLRQHSVVHSVWESFFAFEKKVHPFIVLFFWVARLINNLRWAITPCEWWVAVLLLTSVANRCLVPIHIAQRRLLRWCSRNYKMTWRAKDSRELSNDVGDNNENATKQSLCTWVLRFCTFLCRHQQNNNVKWPNSRRMFWRTWAHDGEFFILPPYLNIVPISLVPRYFNHIVQVERIGIIAK